MENPCTFRRIVAAIMELTAEQLRQFVDDQQERVARFVAPEAMGEALAGIREKLAKRLPQVPDRRSLENLVEVEAVDFALRPLSTEFAKESPDHGLIEQLFAWGGRYLEQQLRKTIRLHVGRLHAGADPGEVDATLAAVLGLLWERRREFDPSKGAFVPWARGIALNRARSHRQTQRREVSLDSDPQRPLDVPNAAPSAEELATAPNAREGPPSEGFAEILKLVQESEPHKALAFLLSRYLEQKPARILEEARDMTLAEVLASVKQAVRARFPEIAGIDALLAPLSARVNGLSGTFAACGREEKNLAEEIGRWVAEVQRSVSGALTQLGKRFLRCVSELSAAVHEIVCFLWIRFLDAAPVELREEVHRELLPLIELFHDAYSRRELLARKQVEWATEPLRDRIRPGRKLGEFAGADFYAALQRWCQHIDSLIPGAACAENALGYAYVTGLLRKGRPA